MSKIGDRIREIRGSMSQKELAEKLGIRKNYISNYETRGINPTAEVLIAFAAKLNININWLLTGEGSMYYNESDNSRDKMIKQLQTDLNEKDKQLQRIRAAAGDAEIRVDKQNSEIARIRAAETVIVDKLYKKSKLKKK